MSEPAPVPGGRRQPRVPLDLVLPQLRPLEEFLALRVPVPSLGVLVELLLHLKRKENKSFSFSFLILVAEDDEGGVRVSEEWIG